VTDRQEIDALLIGALYGELTPADEARLNAHLESHPADKTALADLTSARNAVRESRFLTVQLEPPQAVSALLLQEASRRAKPIPVKAQDEKREGWFARFVSSFARHPAMAAAAMLVVVIGVAGTLYMRGGAQSAERTTRSLEESPAFAPAVEPRGGGGDTGADALARNAGSAYEAQLAPLEQGAAGATKTGDRFESGADAKDANAVAESKKERAPARTYFGTESKPTPKPMDLDDRRQEQAKGAAKPDTATVRTDDDEAENRTRPGAGVTGGAPRGTTAPGIVAPRNDPASPPPSAPKTVGRAPGPDDQRDGKLEVKEKVDPETTWAREQHGRVAAAVRANNCKDATQLAMALFNRAPAYYNANVESDRALKQCITYITAEREREVERTQRARELQRRNEEARDRVQKAPSPTTTNK
jgi:anti-sigma factor RsiW